MNGSWHRYRPGERWRRPAGRARLVLEVPGAVAVCFDAPVVELLEQRAETLHPSLGRLGPDLLAPEFDADEAIRRLRDPSRAGMSIAEALLDQRALAGIGNVYKSEPLDRAGLAVRAGRRARRCHPDPARRDRPPAPARERGRRTRSGTGHHGGRPGSARAALRLSPDRPPVPPLPDADRQRATGDRDPADDLLVSDASRTDPGRLARPKRANRRVSSPAMCEHFVARADRSRSGSTSCGRSPRSSSGSGWPASAGAPPGWTTAGGSGRTATCARSATIPGATRSAPPRRPPRSSTCGGHRGSRR